MMSPPDAVSPETAATLRETYAQWSDAAAAVLAKAARTEPGELTDSPENLLAVQTRDGLTVRPLYTRKDQLAELGLPGEFPYVRGADPVRDVKLGWRVTERFGDIAAASPEALNEEILAAAGSGTSGLWLAFGAGLDTAGLETALRGVYLDLLPVTLDAGADGIAAAQTFLGVLQDAPVPPSPIAPTAATTHSLGLSPYTAAFSGRPTVSLDLATSLGLSAPDGVRTFRVDGTDFAQAGATNAQELGLLAAAALTHVRDLVGAGATVERAVRQVTFAVSVDDDQFAAIAKLRALRAVWARIAQVLGVPEAGAAITHAVTDLSMFTQRDPWVNMLRSTIAAFGAGVGGADQVTVLNYDAAIPAADRTSKAAFSARIARNTQLLLLEESNIGRVLDPAGGSWYVEEFTAELAGAAWEVFTGVEAHGGYPEALASGLVADQIAQSLAARDRDVAHRAQAITGVSEFPNLGENPLPASTAAATDLTAAAPSLARAARHYEELRDRADAATAATGKRPSVLLLPLGSVAEHNGRTTFIANLLAAGGIEAINPGPLTLDRVAPLVAEHDAVVAVLCGPKHRYAEDGPMVLAAAREAGVERVLLAGPDREWPSSELIPDGSLKVGIDAVATLTGLLNLLTTGRPAAG